MATRLKVYRVDANVAGLRKGALVEIDPTDPGWRPLIAAGYLRPHDVDPPPPRRAARVAVPDVTP